MTEHDRVRMDRALKCDRTNLSELEDAVRGLQSTDDPSLLSLYNDLMTDYVCLKKRVADEAARLRRTEDVIRVLRVVEYVGPRYAVEHIVGLSVHGERKYGKVTIRAATVGEFPEILERDHAEDREADDSQAEPRPGAR